METGPWVFVTIKHFDFDFVSIHLSLSHHTIDNTADEIFKKLFLK